MRTWSAPPDRFTAEPAVNLHTPVCDFTASSKWGAAGR